METLTAQISLPWTREEVTSHTLVFARRHLLQATGPRLLRFWVG
jgi:hypothetical protein